MNWYLPFYSPRPTPYAITMSNSTSAPACTSWYGHKFEKFDAETIFCPTCGTTKSVKK